jgi:hypothetical protein
MGRKQPNKETVKAIQEVSEDNRELLESIEQLQPTQIIQFGNDFYRFELVFNAIGVKFYTLTDKDERLELNTKHKDVKELLGKYIIKYVSEPETTTDTNILETHTKNKLNLLKAWNKILED